MPSPTNESRFRGDGIDARRFDPVPTAPGAAPNPGAAPGSNADPRALPRNGYEFAPPSGQSISPLPETPPAQALPGAGSFGAGGLGPGGLGPNVNPNASPVLLGVNGTDTPTGVLITRVVPGTPADVAGLTRGDRILTVGGYQVGLVSTQNGVRAYPLGVELARRLDAAGMATLLVQDGRTRQVTTVTVRPVPRYGPTNPPAYQPFPQSPFGPAPGLGAGLNLGVGPFDLGIGAGRGTRFDPYRRTPPTPERQPRR
ncbi:MAG: PDZ domain-containing protein [Planctomycetota bacterium]